MHDGGCDNGDNLSLTILFAGADSKPPTIGWHFDAEAHENCPKCSNRYMSDSKFCRRCGTKRATQDQVSVGSGERVRYPGIQEFWAKRYCKMI